MRWHDALLLAAAAALVLAGPLMALGELAQAEADARREATGAAVVATDEHRAVSRVVLPVLVLATLGFGGFRLWRVHRRPEVRAVARRPGLVLLAGLALLGFAWFWDWGYFLQAGYLARGAYVLLAYPAAAALVLGSAYVLARVDASFTSLRA